MPPSSRRAPSTLKSINSQQTIFKAEDRYSTFPWVERVDASRLVLVFRQADLFSRDAARAGQVTHHDAASWIAALESTDNGRSWQRDSYRVVYQSDYGVNDPAITRMSDGAMVLRVCEIDVRPSARRASLQGALVSHRVEHARVGALRGNVWTRLEMNASGGATAGQLIQAGDLTHTCSREPITELADGTWLLPVYAGAPFRTDAAHLLRSYDRGTTWGDPSVMLRDDAAGPSDLQGINFNETSIVSFDDGEMLAVGRADRSFHSEGAYIPVGGVGELYLTRSFNWGLSWTRPEKSGVFGQPAHVLRVDGDRVICAYGYRKKPYGIRVVESADRGRTWQTSDTLVLRDDGATWDVGYPMTLKLDDGLFLTVYYFTGEDSVRYIAGSTWTLE